MIRELTTVLCAATLAVVVTGTRANSFEYDRAGIPESIVCASTFGIHLVGGGSHLEGIDPDVVWSINVFLPVPK